MSEKCQETSVFESQTISDLKRKLKGQMMQFNNERLLLEHKNELLRQELIELKEREINQNKLHESMFNKVMSQSSADPNEFITKQLELIKEINAKEMNELKGEVIEKNKRIKELSEQLGCAHDKLNRTDNEFMHRSKDMELKIRELELQNKMLEEDRDRIECENTLLVEELLATEKNHESHDSNKVSEEQVYLNNEDGEETNEISDIRMIELEDKIQATLIENDNAKKLINKLKNKSKKLKENLQKSETINNHNIILLQTQFEKEQNQWEKDRFNYQQEILLLKKQNMSLQHLVKKYQYNEQISASNSCLNCNHSSNIDTKITNQLRAPFTVIDQCCNCSQKAYENCCSFNYSKTQPLQCTCSVGCKDRQYSKGYDNQICESQNCICLNSDRSENDFINPLLTQDSRQQHQKILSQYCDNSRKGSRNSYNKRVSCTHNDSHSLTMERNDAFKSKIIMNSSNNNGISECNPVCDSDSQHVDSNDYRRTRNINLQHSKSFTNILKNSKFSLNKDNSCGNLQHHLENFNKRSNSRQKSGAELIKESSKEYNSSIHQCKPMQSHGIYPPRQLTEDCDNFEIKEDIDNVMTNGSESENSKFNGINPNKFAFGTHSNISLVPANHEEEISSSDELAVNMMNRNYQKGNHVSSYRQFPHPQRYNKSFVKQTGLKVDTSPNALLLKDICEAAHTAKYTNVTENRMLNMMRNTSGCQSTKNLNCTAFTKPKRTVSINLFMNESEGDHKSTGSKNSNFGSAKESVKYKNSSNKLSTMRKQAKLGITSRNTYINETLKQAYSKFGNRKNTLEENSHLANLSKQLEKTEQALNNVSRKQSQQMTNIQDKIRIIKEQLDSHKKHEIQNSIINNSSTPTPDSRIKKKNMSKYIQSKTRNNMYGIQESKTAEKVYSKKDQRPMTSTMLNIMTNTMQQIPSDRKTMDSNMTRYIKMSCNRNNTNNFGSMSSGKNYMSYVDTDQSDKTTQKHYDYSTSSHVITLSECHDDQDHLYSNRPRIIDRNDLMHIQEEQEYTTNEREDVMMGSSCKCETDEDPKSSNKDFIKNYCYSNNHAQLEEESDVESEVLLHVL